jgi:hypothetical protein
MHHQADGAHGQGHECGECVEMNGEETEVERRELFLTQKDLLREETQGHDEDDQAEADAQPRGALTDPPGQQHGQHRDQSQQRQQIGDVGKQGEAAPGPCLVTSLGCHRHITRHDAGRGDDRWPASRLFIPARLQVRGPTSVAGSACNGTEPAGDELAWAARSP